MAIELPPVPINEPPDSFAWQQWYLQLQRVLGTTGAVGWALIDFSGSDLSDIAARDHADLQNMQGGITGERYHLTSAQQLDLTDGGDSTSHFHATDRARANHTGTQTASTISDFDEAAQDAVGGILTDSATVNFTYDDALGTITADVTATAVDHGALTGLGDDDHTQYLLAAGTRALSADWDAGSFEIRAQTFESDVITGTAPLVVASTTKVTNLNADLLDGEEASAFADAVHTHTVASITDLTASAAELNTLDGITATVTELNYTDGVTSAIQTQIDGKQASDAGLTDIAGLAATDGNFIVGNGTNWVAESGATARTSLGLGSLATASTINNDNWSGTDLSVANGGTGVSSLTAYAVVCGGTTGTGAVQSVASVGTSGQALISNGAAALPTFQDIPGGAAAATQAEQETGSSTSVYTSPGRQQYHQSAVKAWAEFTDTGTIQLDYNVTSVSDDGTGLFTVTWDTDFSSTTYAITAMASHTLGQLRAVQSRATPAAGTAAFCCRDEAGNAADTNQVYFVIACGDHA